MLTLLDSSELDQRPFVTFADVCLQHRSASQVSSKRVARCKLGARDAPFPRQTLPVHFKQLTGPVGTCLFNFQVGSVTLCIFRWWSLIAACASFSAAQGGPRRTAGCKRRVPWRPIPSRIFLDHFKQLTGPVGTCLFNFRVGSVTLCNFRRWSLMAARASLGAAQGGLRRGAGCKIGASGRHIPLVGLPRSLQTTYQTSRNVFLQVSSWISDPSISTHSELPAGPSSKPTP